MELGVHDSAEEFVQRNLTVQEKYIKCILLGDKQVGKTMLRNKLLDENGCISPTTTLDIKKKIIFYRNSPIKLEIWDTNHQIQCSPIIQSK